MEAATAMRNLISRVAEAARRFEPKVRRLLGIVLGLCVWMSVLASRAADSNQPPLKLWFAQPAEKWTDAMPIGNGRMGAMVFGRVPDERIQFNEDTLWRGHPHDYVRKGARQALPEVRRLLAEGKDKQAALVARPKFLSDPVRQMPYQPFGDLHIHFAGQEDPTAYRRELDLDDAVARVTYRANGVEYQREAFASYPDQVIVYRVTSDQPGKVSFTLKMDSPQTNSQTRAIGPDTLALTGQVQAGGLRFESRVRVRHTGGRLTTNGNSIAVEKADSATLLLVAATSFRNFMDITGNPDARCAKYLARLRKKDFNALRAAHVADYRRLFDRVSLDLGRTDRANLPTDQRLEEVKKSGLEGDPALAALYFQFGRYLLIASSRPGSEPANLQGVWNELLNPPWESKYTLNINFEMNYWISDVGNLGECEQPLFDMIDDLVINGGRTAREQYGCRGWVVHHNTDLWRGSAPINNIDGIWPTGGAWLCHRLWEHYLFTGDKGFLARRAYPVMKQASLFFEDFLIKDPKTGWLVTSPSYSPEQGTLTIGPTMDEQLIRALMEHTVEAARLLHKDADFSARLRKVCAQLAPNQVGKHGQLQEWLTDIDVPNNNHRHMSPLWAMYPGADITPADPRIWNAAKVLLKWRGDGSTGWSYAWRIPLWARVGDGDFAYHQLDELLKRKTLPSLLDLCGPFQIDGNLGAPAGIAEMLVQSQLTRKSENGSQDSAVRIVDLLPALPKAWPTGSVTGLCARDGFVVDIAWEKGALRRAVIHSALGRPCIVRYGERTVKLTTKAGRQYQFDGQLRPETRN